MRHFPIAKGKERLLHWLWRPASFGQFRRSTVLKNNQIKINCDLGKYLQRHLYFLGEYEAEDCRLWASLAKKASVVFDVGANVGVYSLIAAAANRAAAIQAFEPTPEIFDSLCENIQTNSYANIVPHREAVGSSKGIGFLRHQSGTTGDNEGMNYVSDHQTSDRELMIARISLDEFCHEHQIERIDLLKIDVEGGEHDVLLGAKELLQRKAIAL